MTKNNNFQSRPVFPKPNIIISKCIEFDHCRYNGQMIYNELVKKLINHVNFIPVCPEVEIGLGVPRNPVRLVFTNNQLHLTQPSENMNYTQKMQDFSTSFLNTRENIDGFLLKYKSPSCGPSKVRVYYEGKGSNEDPRHRTKKHGLFALKAKELFPYFPMEDEARLLNYKIRDDFLTKIFTLADFREKEKNGKIKDLIEFHAANKFLFMSYNQSEMRKLGRLTANHEKKTTGEVYQEYKYHLLRCMKTPPKRSSMINVLEHMFGFFKQTLSPGEKQFFLDSIILYKEERIPLSSVVMIIKTWALRDRLDYLLQQTLLSPYPKELLELSDSGKLLDL